MISSSNHSSSLLLLCSLTLIVCLCGLTNSINANIYPTVAPFSNIEHITIDTTDREIFKVVESMPRFPGCEDLENTDNVKSCAARKMLEFIYGELVYPPEARANGIEGTVVIQFIVEKSGNLSEFKIIRRIGGGCEEEALRVIQSMPQWIPGKQRGKNVEVQFNLPVKFVLSKKTIKENRKRGKKKNRKG